MPDRHFELPPHPDLEYYRKQAKHLQRTYETGDAAAQAQGSYASMHVYFATEWHDPVTQQLHHLLESRSRN